MNWDHTNSDQDDPLLDACLDEVLAGRTPPDVAPRVLRAVYGASMPEPPPVQPLVAAAPPVVTVSVLGEMPASDVVSRPVGAQWMFALAIAVAAGFVGLGLTIGIVAMFRNGAATVAENSPTPPETRLDGAGVAALPSTSPQGPDEKQAGETALPQSPLSLPPLPQLALDPGSSAPPESIGLPQPSTAQPAAPDTAPRPAASSEQIVSFVNAELQSVWTASGVSLSPTIGDDEWCDRLFRRTLGRGPTAAELTEFRSDEASLRRQNLLDRVLGDEYHSPLARHWGRILTAELLGSTAPRAESLASRENLERYLIASLRNKKPLGQIVTELITARGAVNPGPSYNPAVNFLVDGWEPKGMLATSRVARVFLGTRIECAQCHTHPTEGWTQDQYWSLNAFFRQMKVETTDEVTRLANVNFPGEGRSSRDGEIYFETPEKLVKSAWPVFLDGTKIPTGGQLSVVDRRRELARLVVQSEYLPRALVNLVWAHYFDFGLRPSLFDLDTSRPSLHDELLDRLSAEFAASGLDLKSLIRWTVMSEAFLRSAKLTDLVSKDMPESGEAALFSRYYSRPLVGTDLMTSLVQAQRIRRTTGSSAERDQARVDWLAQFNRAATKTGPKAAAKAKNSSILAQTSTIRMTAGLHAGGIVSKIAAHSMPFDQKVEHLFLTALGRGPSPREARTAASVLSTASDDQTAALEDIWWSLLNSNECILDR